LRDVIRDQHKQWIAVCLNTRDCCQDSFMVTAKFASKWRRFHETRQSVFYIVIRGLQIMVYAGMSAFKEFYTGATVTA